MTGLSPLPLYSPCQITLMGTPILRQENALHSSDVAMFEGHPCSREPCHNGGRCNPLLESYECVCLLGFTGTHCQNSKRTTILNSVQRFVSNIDVMLVLVSPF